MTTWDARGSRTGFVTVGGAALYTEARGAGEPVLLLHGGFCSLESLASYADALVETHEVVAFERPGHGRSADVDGEYDYSHGVAQAVTVLDALGIESAHVIGYSDGAIIGLLLAMERPERVRSLVAISANLDPTAFTWSPEGVGAPVLTPPRAAAPPSARPDSDPPAVEEPDVEREAYDRLSPDGPEHGDVVLAKLMRLWTTEPHIDPADLARIAAPTLVLAADRDNIRLDHSAVIAASIPGAQLGIVPGTTHGLVAERPRLVTLVIREFLAGLD